MVDGVTLLNHFSVLFQAELFHHLKISILSCKTGSALNNAINNSSEACLSRISDTSC